MSPQISQGSTPTASKADSRPASIRFDGVCHRFGSRNVFSDVNGEIGSGEILTVTGANGSGKSTLLRIASGLLQPHSGSVDVQVEGRSLDRVARRAFIGYAAPDLSLYRELTAAENLTFFASLRGIRLERSDLIEMLTAVGLRGRGRDLVGGYSSGMRTRLKLGYATIGDPPILILDEPTANLDADGMAIVESLVFRHRERRGVVVIGTNEAREVAWGDRRIQLGETRSP